MTEPVNVEALLTRLSESRLSSDQRRTSLDDLRQRLAPNIAIIFKPLPEFADALALVTRAIQNGPNDVRRVALQTLSSQIETDQFRKISDDSVQSAVKEIIVAIEAFLKSALKVQSPKFASHTHARSSVDVESLPTSALRATAAALKTLHALIRITPHQDNPTTPHRETSRNVAHLSGIIDIILPCLSAGLQSSRQVSGSTPRSGSSLPAGVFSWKEQPRQSRISPSKSNQTLRTATNGVQGDAMHSSSGETDRKSDKSESERSDFSTASVATTSSKSYKDELRQLEAMTKLIRQNSLHCLVELNRHESRALVSRWGDILPDQPAPFHPTKNVEKPALSSSRLSAALGPSAPFSLCTLITQDPSTSVRIAAMRALESVLSHGTLQLSMVQERAQRVLSFTSLSSQMAGWIVNIRSYLLVALQRAASAPRALGSSEAAAFPSSLVVALMQLTHTFVISTAKSKLVTSNAAALGAKIVPFASHNDPEVQAAAKRVIVALAQSSNSTAGPSSSVRRRTQESARVDVVADQRGVGDKRSSEPTDGPQYSPAIDPRTLLGDGLDLTFEVCERMLACLEASEDPRCELSTWSILIKGLADARVPIFDSKGCVRVVQVWNRICSQTSMSSDQNCTVLSTVPELWKALAKHSALDGDSSSCVLRYVEGCCDRSDEAVRAAAVRVLGLLILPPDSTASPVWLQSIPATRQQRVSSLLCDVLWGNHGKACGGALYDSSSLVRQRASWAFSNAMEARLRAASLFEERDWVVHSRYCLEAGKDIEGVAVSACRASGILLAMLEEPVSTEACSLAKDMLEQLRRVLSTKAKPPKSQWNAASALDRALSSEVVLARVLEPCGTGEELLEAIVELLCSSLAAKVFKIRVSAAYALLSLCVGADKAGTEGCSTDRLSLLGEKRRMRIQGFAAARLAELAEPTQSKESALYVDELKRILARLVECCSPAAIS